MKVREYLVVGLGNVGCKYNNTYHNLGFDVVDNLISKYDVIRRKELTYVSLVWIDIEGKSVIVAKPKTYMNASGSAVKNIMKKYHISLADVIVACDDLDLPQGAFRYRTHGSGGTHNGLRDIVRVLGSTEFARVRVGFGPKLARIPLDKFVVSHISKDERAIINPAVENATLKIIDFILGKIQ